MLKTVFLITSTLNTIRGIYTVDQRFEQTKLTITSIRNRVPDAIIVLCDNSLLSVESKYLEFLRCNVDELIPFNQSLFSKFVYDNIAFSNGIFAGVGELLIYEQAFAYIQKYYNFDRVFKISSRYQLTDTFRLDEYLDSTCLDKFVFKGQLWKYWNDIDKSENFITTLDTTLWSMPKTLIDSFLNDYIHKVFHSCVMNGKNIETSMTQNIPNHLIQFREKTNITGTMADGTLITNW